jgi:polyhydroxybutyrate depolymerase
MIKRNILFLLSVIFMLSCAVQKKNNETTNPSQHSLIWQGYERRYLLRLPPKEKMQPKLPILFVLHGGGGKPEGMISLTNGRFHELADQDGFIIVYPAAIDKNWNDGRKDHYVSSWQKNIDDVGFIVAIIEQLKEKYLIDTNRIFSCGMSNGGFMTSRLLCDRSDVVRAGAIITATLSEDYVSECQAETPSAVLVINGTADPLVPYDGGYVTVFRQKRGKVISTADFIALWKEKNGCLDVVDSLEIKNSVDDGTYVRMKKYANCKNASTVAIYTVYGGGHCWPGGKQYLGKRIIGKTNYDINATDIIWDFFKNLP